MVKSGYGTGYSEGKTGYHICYRIFPMDENGNRSIFDDLSEEVLREIESSLYEADLVLELGVKSKRYDLKDYQTRASELSNI